MFQSSVLLWLGKVSRGRDSKPMASTKGAAQGRHPPSDAVGQAAFTPTCSPGPDFSQGCLLPAALGLFRKGWQRPWLTHLSFQSFCFSLHKLPCPYLIRGLLPVFVPCHSCCWSDFYHQTV